jgi:hypothetical protein
MLPPYSRGDIEAVIGALETAGSAALQQRDDGAATGHFHYVSFWDGCRHGLALAGDLLRRLLGDPPRHERPKPLANILASPEVAEHGLDPLTLTFKEIALRGGTQFDTPPWMTFTVEDDPTPYRVVVERHGRRYEADIYRENPHRPTFWHLYLPAVPAATPEAAVADSLDRFWPLYRQRQADAEATVRRIIEEAADG